MFLAHRSSLKDKERTCFEVTFNMKTLDTIRAKVVKYLKTKDQYQLVEYLQQGEAKEKDGMG
nr:2484_t:CDS:2 [Entrophospora candida]